MQEIKLGNRLREIREKNNYTQEELAEKLFITRQTVSGWERGRSEPSISALQLLSKIYNVSIDELLHNTISVRSYYKALRAAMALMFGLGIALTIIVLWSTLNSQFSLLPIVVCFAYCVITNLVILISFLVFDKRGY